MQVHTTIAKFFAEDFIKILKHCSSYSSMVMYLLVENDFNGEECGEKPALSGIVWLPEISFSVPLICIIGSLKFRLTSSPWSNVWDGDCTEGLFMLIFPTTWFVEIEADWWAFGRPGELPFQLFSKLGLRAFKSSTFCHNVDKNHVKPITTMQLTCNVRPDKRYYHSANRKYYQTIYNIIE